MRIMVLFAHPLEDSFNAALHRTVVTALRESGHEVDDCDLYAEGFNPVLSAEERRHYHDETRNRAPVAGYVDRLLAAEALILCHPTWCFGLPAILKGFLDRVLMPGVSFTPKPDEWISKAAAFDGVRRGKAPRLPACHPNRRIAHRADRP